MQFHLQSQDEYRRVTAQKEHLGVSQRFTRVRRFGTKQLTWAREPFVAVVWRLVELRETDPAKEDWYLHRHRPQIDVEHDSQQRLSRKKENVPERPNIDSSLLTLNLESKKREKKLMKGCLFFLVSRTYSHLFEVIHIKHWTNIDRCFGNLTGKPMNNRESSQWSTRAAGSTVSIFSMIDFASWETLPHSVLGNWYSPALIFVFMPALIAPPWMEKNGG